MDTQEKQTVSSRKKSMVAVYQISLAGIFLALAVVFAAMSKFIPFLKMPNGGSISLAMVPLTLGALILGPIWGTFIGLVFGVFDMLMDTAMGWSWVTLVLDYFLAFSVVGVSGFFRKAYFRNKTWSLVVGMLVFGILRFTCHFFSGCTVWSLASGNVDYASVVPDFSKASIIYSAGYNSMYVIPSVTIGIIVMMMISKPLFILNRTPMMKALSPVEEDGLSQDNDNSVLNYSLFFGALVAIVMSLFGCFPTVYYAEWGSFMGYSYLGYFGLIAGALVVGFSVYRLVKCIKENSEFSNPDSFIAKVFKKPMWMYVFFIVLGVIAIACGSVAIASYYTYAYDLYHPAEE